MTSDPFTITNASITITGFLLGLITTGSLTADVKGNVDENSLKFIPTITLSAYIPLLVITPHSIIPLATGTIVGLPMKSITTHTLTRTRTHLAENVYPRIPPARKAIGPVKGIVYSLKYGLFHW